MSSYNIEVVNGVTVITILQRRATAEIAREFKDFLFDLIDAQGITKMVIDLKDVQFMDSFFLGAIVTGLKKIRNLDGDIKLAAMMSSLRPVFELMHLDEVFTICEDVPSAVRHFV